MPGRGRGVRRKARNPTTAKRQCIDLPEAPESDENTAQQVQGLSSRSRTRTMSGPNPSVECLQSRAKQLLNASLSANTLGTYRTALVTFQDFCSVYKLKLQWPITQNQVILFISFCFEKGLSPNTISTYVAGITYYNKLNEGSDFGEVFIIRKLLEGCRRSRKRRDLRAPVTLKILTEICSLLPIICYDVFESKLFKAMFVLAYFGMFRVSELVVTNQLELNRPVQYQDVTFQSDNTQLTIVLRMSKTNHSNAPTTIRIKCENNDKLCPVCALNDYIVVRPKIIGPLFIHANMKPVTRCQFSGVLSKCLCSSSFASEKIRSHSFRIGRATQLATMGIPTDAIMKLGRWHSGAYRRYIRL
ncbi:uncharacterized protein LOC123552767 isoform X1 [Mercenaria mercenaria]|uniref:uncharacterized protein LOC123552767 isoform X1 n=1 Tax=Mercenaria mercenaria TaxID=6596 RepID=UPI00234E57BE|nr:uncharacterized protein LOC123552767 isoform X1 [Mercenaria mercenaria]